MASGPTLSSELGFPVLALLPFSGRFFQLCLCSLWISCFLVPELLCPAVWGASWVLVCLSLPPPSALAFIFSPDPHCPPVPLGFGGPHLSPIYPLTCG